MNNIKKEKKVFDSEYFAKKSLKSYYKNKPLYWIEIDGKTYVFKKEKLQRIKPKFVDTLVNPIELF